MDMLDRAQQLEEQHRAKALTERTQYKGISADFCSECGADIPELRQQAVPGIDTCIYCQTRKEAKI